ncbi:phosphoribosyltransferase family protein [Aliarcobacter butzleri]|uniref:phosphoribosyltransferase family protein n=1 Tax=Aliarcobacter butzleri TaxID=28197 RepID=UPI00263CA8B6|nr:phosphoribosyltransferase family protein [Aliarcobacter butzleri]MDN5048640.1 phosphoribosyltransferase family protein [Aliarcobacter butzleri]MDN5056742.1 phosphoribosyltransferase family protein [Aliarcobacter butzleri]
MICLTCKNLSLEIICKDCQKNLLVPSFHKREIEDGFFNYSFYSLSELEDLINSKYYFYGDRVFNILAKLSFAKFALNFDFPSEVLAIPIDDHTRHDFSHCAILAKHLKSKTIKPKYNSLKATNIVKYAGKNLEFRQKNSRKFQINNLSDKFVILCDDLITTGTTIIQAKKALEKKNNQILFSLTLADAKL